MQNGPRRRRQQGLALLAARLEALRRADQLTRERAQAPPAQPLPFDER